MKRRKSKCHPVPEQEQTDSKGSNKVRAGRLKNSHPLRGVMKDSMRIMPGTDLTQPADPDWGTVWDEKP